MNELSTDGLRRACSVHSSSPARPVDRQTAVPCVALIYLYAFQAAVLDRDTPSTTHPVDLVVSRETCNGPLHWYSVDTVRTPLYRPRGHPQAPTRRRRIRHLSEGVERPTTRLRAEHRLSAHANRRERVLFFASERVWDPLIVFIARRATGTFPGEGPEHPVPARQYDPWSIGATSTGRISTSSVLQ